MTSLQILKASGEALDVDAEGAASVGELRGRVAAARGTLSPECIQLLQGDCVLEDAVLLSDLGSGAVLTAMMSDTVPLQGVVSMSGDLDGLHHTDAQLAEFRSKHCQIYNGDWDIKVEAIPRTEMDWDKFCAANVKAELVDDCDDPSKLLDLRPADVLWDASNFGELYWSWTKRSGLSGVYGMDADTGQEFLPRIWCPLTPDAGVAEVREACTEALAQLEAMPANLKNGMPKSEMAALIETDVGLLEALVAKRGSFGAAALPDALMPIVSARQSYNDGNTKTATFATADYCFHIHFATS